jgi:hypothetical protein
MIFIEAVHDRGYARLCEAARLNGDCSFDGVSGFRAWV